MYLPALTDDELLRHARTLNLTALETELVKRFEDFKAENDGIEQEIERLEGENKELREKVEDLEEKVDELSLL